jgi:membrane protein required for colicin V production
MINIIIILFLIYFGYFGYRKGFIRELSNMISYIFGLLLSRLMFSIFSDSLSTLIIQDRLRDKISYLISFMIIVYIFKILTRFIESLIDLKWKNKLLGLTLGILNGIIILSLTISIFKELLPSSFGDNQSNKTQSILYQNIDLLQKNYLIQYKEDIK